MILDNLVNGQIQLSKSERKIASFILKNPSKIINQSISSLAEDTGVSLPSVNRFCKKLGFGGYPALKIQLAQELSSNNRLLVENLQVDKDTPEIVKRVMSDIQATVINVGQNLDPKSIDAATNLIAAAKSLNFFGLGGSGPVALDAQHKFFRFGIPVVAHADYINQRMIVSMMNAGDVLVLISYTGRTEELIKTARVAKNNKIKTIALTTRNSPLSRLSNIALHVDAPLENNLHIPMTSRLAHLAIIDILSATVSAYFGNSLDKKRQEIIKNLDNTRV